MRLIRIGHFPSHWLLLTNQALQAVGIAVVPTGNHGRNDGQHEGHGQA
jgi:hypothetical protein